MRPALLLALTLAAAAAASGRAAAAPDGYGEKGLFPVYASGGHWLIYDKTDSARASRALRPGGRFLLIGSRDAAIFSVAHVTAAFGGICRKGKPARLRAALLYGPRKTVGDPILAIKVPSGFTLKGSRAVYRTLPNAVDESVYKSLETAIASATIREAESGAFRLKPQDSGAREFLSAPDPAKILVRIDYAARPAVAGLKRPLVLVTGAQISDSFRRCLRLADGGRLIGDCVEMPSDLMAETALLRFVSYDPSGGGRPLLLAYTPKAPLWGHERWGFVLRASGARLFLRDAMDPRCRASF